MSVDRPAASDLTLSASRTWSRLSKPWKRGVPLFAPIAVCTYVAGFAFLPSAKLALLVLGLLGLLAVLFSEPRKEFGSWPPLIVPLALFVLTTVLSVMESAHVSKSFWLSAPMFPGALLFFLLAQHFESTAQVRALYVTVSAAALVLAGLVLSTALRMNVSAVSDVGMRKVATAAGSPILRVPNDIAVLAVLAPLSLALIYRKPRGFESALGAISLLFGAGAIVAMRSRTATLTLIGSLTVATLLTLPRRRLKWALAVIGALVILALAVDWAIGAPLASKFLAQWRLGRRADLWATGWDMFLKSPLLGHGPGTFGRFNEIRWAHNLYLEFLAERGILSFVTLAALIGGGGIAGRRLLRTASGEARLFGAAAIAGLLGLCLAGLVELTFLRLWVVICFLLLLGLVVALSSQSARKRT